MLLFVKNVFKALKYFSGLVECEFGNPGILVLL